MTYALIARGSSSAPQLVVEVRAHDDEAAMSLATNYSEMMWNRWYWNFNLVKDGKVAVSWQVAGEPVIKNVVKHV